MFLAGGALYVFQVYGVHFCANVVTGPKDYPAAVLLRATEPPTPDRSARGPGRLGRAYGIDRSDDGSSLLGGDIWLEAGRPVDDREVRATARIGVDYAGEWADRPFRFVIAGCREVSGPKRLR